jgi:hypothetical protein
MHACHFALAYIDVSCKDTEELCIIEATTIISNLLHVHLFRMHSLGPEFCGVSLRIQNPKPVSGNVCVTESSL